MDPIHQERSNAGDPVRAMRFKYRVVRLGIAIEQQPAPETA